MNDNIRDFYDKYVDIYDHHMRDTGHYQAQKILFRTLDTYFRGDVLELAGGPGYLAKEILESGKISKYYFNDISSHMLDYARKKLATFEIQVSYYQQDAEKIEIESKVSTILCCNLFYYIQNKDNAIKKWKELLQKDGHIILFEEYPFIYGKSGKSEEFGNDLPNVVNPINPEAILRLFTYNNFTLIKKEKEPIDNQHDLYGFIFKYR